MRRRGITFWHNDSGATAALYALALPALVAAAGIAFDYARVASMDTELQNAADQAALAGATQLDRLNGAQARAIAAIAGSEQLVTNLSLFANDGGERAVELDEGELAIVFFATKGDAEAGSNGFYNPGSATDDARAGYVRVTVATRRSNYALTPVVGALYGELGAQAVAGLGSALCRTPPLMICNPDEPPSNTDATADFGIGSHIGKGLLVKQGGQGAWAPGNFGYLDTGGAGGAVGVRQALGWTSPPGECISQSGVDTVDTQTGNIASATQALNTRFDIYDNQGCESGGACPASINSRKDMMRAANASGINACKLHDTQGWREVPIPNGPGVDPSEYRYLPSANAPYPDTKTPVAIGHPRDICHATATNLCPGSQHFGTRVWDWDAYFRSHYGWNASEWRSYTQTGQQPVPLNPLGSGGPTRYSVYLWEIANRASPIAGVSTLGSNPAGATGNTLVNHGAPVCSASEGYGSGTVPGSTTADRRRISVAVVNCNAHSVRGNSRGVPVRRWMDVFLVQPSASRDRTAQDEIYVEIIGETQAGSAGETAGTVIRRDVPFLVR